MNLDNKKQVKMQWLQHPYQSNLDNLNNIRHEVSRYFWIKRKPYLKSKLKNLNVRQKEKKSETDTGSSVTLRRVTSLELI